MYSEAKREISRKDFPLISFLCVLQFTEYLQLQRIFLSPDVVFEEKFIY